MHQSIVSEQAYDHEVIGRGNTAPTALEPKATPKMTVPNDIAGNAALSIVESLLLALNDRNILPEAEIIGILKDAAAAHDVPSTTSAPDGEAAMHAAVAALIKGIITGGNSVRRR